MPFLLPTCYCLLLAAPAGAPAAPAASPTAPDPLVALIREVTRDVEALRGLKRKHTLKVQVLDDQLFTAAVRAKAAQELTPELVAAERARWLAFGLAPPDADPVALTLAVLDEQVAGFYDPQTKTLSVRKQLPAGAAADLGPDGLRIILAHEIEHALQDQNFGLVEPSSLPDDDARFGLAALYEGDAMAAMTAYAARRAGRPVRAAIAAAAATMRSLDTDALLRATGRSPELAKAPAVLREELILPYSAGFALVAEVVRRGGFAAVDKMFKSPPRGSHDVLHPEGYLAGEPLVRLAPPPAPKGTTVVATGRMGELGARLVLEGCVDKAVVRDFAPRWRGDAYTLVEGPHGALSVLWATSFAEGGGQTLANLLGMQQACWDDAGSAPRQPAPGGLRISPANQTKVEGDRTGFARGSIDLDRGATAALATAAQVQQGPPPLGALPAPATTAAVRDGVFHSARLGLQGPVPEGYASEGPARDGDLNGANGRTELSLRKPGPAGGEARLVVVERALSPDEREAVFQDQAARLAAARGGHLSLPEKARRALPFGEAEERSWKLGDGVLRLDLLPLCEGRASLLLSRFESGEGVRAELERFVKGLQPEGTPALCAELE